MIVDHFLHIIIKKTVFKLHLIVHKNNIPEKNVYYKITETANINISFKILPKLTFFVRTIPYVEWWYNNLL